MDRKRWIACNEMVKAIQEKNCDAVRNLLDEGFDVDAELMLHKYPITICIGCDSIEIGELLISRGCSLSLKAMEGSTPLHLAVQLLNFDFVKLLLDNRADLTSIDDRGKTVLHLAAQMNCLRMVELLMEKATSVVLNIVDKEGKTPFIYACSYGGEALVSYFLAKGCDANKAFDPCENTPLLSAISNHNCSLDLVNILLDAGANINHINEFSETPLLKTFHMLGVNNFSGATYTIFQNICCLLIDRGSEVNVKNSLGSTPLHFAVAMNNEILVRKLLNSGSLVNATNELGFTPLFYACKNGLQKIATLLLNGGANFSLIKSLVRESQWLWGNETHTLHNSCNVLNYVIQRSKECQNLRNLCRLVIRRNLPISIEKSALLLPLPPSLIKFVQLVE